jgi:alkanesulfonate monooxygenase SsuD/methylene tetrahydromethanopterin reductase-like flavin-dependent oxidoreductase (luciferase family)
MKISIQIEAQSGLTWASWKRWIAEIEQLGFPGLFRSDHFITGGPPHQDSLEMMVSLTYLASASQRLYFGPMVAPLSMRDPVMLARQAMALDDLSGGRMILGVGAGWMEEEHTMFGYPLGDLATRMTRFEEGLEVITRLIRSPEPVNFEGRFFHLREAQLLPRPQRPTPILVGGSGPKRTLPLAARYADIWNCIWQTPQDFIERSTLLDELLLKNNRQPGDVRRTMMLIVICYRDSADLDRRLAHIRTALPEFAHQTNTELVELLTTNFKAVVGTPEVVIPRLQAYAAAGVDELTVQCFTLADFDGLKVLAEEVLPVMAR